MKLTPGRMAHVKVENGCVEALLAKKCGVCPSQEWEAVALRASEMGPYATVIVRSEPVVHEPYGCMREIVILPAGKESGLNRDTVSFGRIAESMGMKREPTFPPLKLNPPMPPRQTFGYSCSCRAQQDGFTDEAKAALAMKVHLDSHSGSRVHFGSLSATGVEPERAPRPESPNVEALYGFVCECGDSQGCAFESLQRVREVAHGHLDAMKLRGDRRTHLISYGREINLR